jgi:F-type H+-transporting ATPase subunit b
MQDILQQLGDLLLSAVPTALLFLVLVFAYQILVQGPLTAVLAKRRALTEGAMEDARNAIAEAESKAADYAERLRLARADVYKLREQRVKQWSADAVAARKVIQSATADLAGLAVRAVLPAAAGGSR